MMTHIPSIGSVMTPFPYVVQVDDSLLVARTLMVEHSIRHLPVKDGSTLVGVLTDRDLKRALDPNLGLPPEEELFVRDVFVADAYVVDVTEPLDGVLDQLSTQHIGSALVTTPMLTNACIPTRNVIPPARSSPNASRACQAM